MSDDKRDRVISMAEFKSSLKEDEQENINFVMDQIDDMTNKRAVISIVITEDGYRFFSSTGDHREIVFGCEALKTFVLKDILDG